MTVRANRPLPDIPEASRAGPADVDVEVSDPSVAAPHDVGGIVWVPAPPTDGAGAGAQHVWSGAGPGGSYVRLRYEGALGALEFVIHPRARSVSVGWDASSTVRSVRDAASLLAGGVFGCVLRLRGVVCLHACVVAMDGRAAVLLGDSGVGKSTTAAALAAHGCAILADDIAAITGPGDLDGARWTVHPGSPRLRLDPVTIEELGLRPHETRPVMTGVEKRYVDLSIAGGGAWRFQQDALPLGAIYVLVRGTARDAVAVEPMTGVDRLGTLLRYVYGAFAPPDPSQRRDELSRLARLAATTPVRRVVVPRGIDRLPELYDAIAADAGAGAWCGQA